MRDGIPVREPPAPEVIAYEKAVRERKMLEELLAAALEREEAARKAAERMR